MKPEKDGPSELGYDPRKQFGLHLIELRKERKFSQEGLALASGLARSYVSGIERGVRNIALENICKLAKTLQVPPSEMLNFLEVDKSSAEVGND